MSMSVHAHHTQAKHNITSQNPTCEEINNMPFQITSEITSKSYRSSDTNSLLTLLDKLNTC